MAIMTMIVDLTALLTRRQWNRQDVLSARFFGFGSWFDASENLDPTVTS
jgi:hypothetical protein